MKRKALILGCAALLAVLATGTPINANSSLQLFEDYGVDYIKHVNFNSASSAKTWLLIKNTGTDGWIQIKFSARAVDGTLSSTGTTIGLDCGQTRSLWLNHSKPITDLNFLQLIKKPASRTKNGM